MRLFDKINVDFLSKRKTAYTISGVLIILGLISLLVRGLELGIDFKGGSEIALQFEKPIEITDIRSYTSEIGLGQVEVKTFGGETGVLIRTELQAIPEASFNSFVTAVEKDMNIIIPGIETSVVEKTASEVTFNLPNADTTNIVNAELFKLGYQTAEITNEPENTQIIVRVGIADLIQNSLREKLPDNHFVVQKEDVVGPKIGEELKTDSIIAVFLALVVILIYLGFRFKFIFAVGAVAALFHDVMITLGVFSMFYGISDWLNLEISVNVVAAFLTLVGYSINDTVVVFDRVRENLKIHKTAEIKDNINNAINSTIPRTIVTSLTTLLVTFILMIFGGEVLRGFAFTLFLGVLVGTYSSIFVASSFVYEYAKKSDNKIQF